MGSFDEQDKARLKGLVENLRTLVKEKTTLKGICDAFQPAMVLKNLRLKPGLIDFVDNKREDYNPTPADIDYIELLFNFYKTKDFQKD